MKALGELKFEERILLAQNLCAMEWAWLDREKKREQGANQEWNEWQALCQKLKAGGFVSEADLSANIRDRETPARNFMATCYQFGEGKATPEELAEAAFKLFGLDQPQSIFAALKRWMETATENKRVNGRAATTMLDGH